MAISSIGVGSNLPLAQLLDNLRASQEVRLTAIEKRQTSVDARITAYGQLKSELTNLSNAAKALSTDAFDAMKTMVTGSDFTASAKTSALKGSYNIKVNTLASAQSLAMAGRASRTDDIGTGGKINFTINGEVKEVDLSTTGTSLEDIVAAINGQDELGVRATILNNGSGTPYQLILTSQTTGTDAAVTRITVTGNAALHDAIQFGAAGSTVSEVAAQNASLEVNGVAINSQSNIVGNVLDGVSLTLTGASGNANTLAISGDAQGVKDAIKGFVDRYNDVLKKIKQVTSYDVEKQTGSALTGDSLTRSIQSRLTDVLNTTSGSGAGAFSMLSDIGIRTDPQTGQLQINDAALDKAMQQKPADIQALFRGDNGIAKRAMDAAATFTDSKDGLLVSASAGATRTLKDLDRQYASAKERIDAQMEVYRKQFTQMDVLVSQLNSTSSYLTQQLSQLGSSKS